MVPALFQSSVAVGLIATACYIAATLLVYVILKPVNRDVSLFAALCGLGSCASAIFSVVFRIAHLIVLGRSPYLIVLTLAQRRAIAQMLLGLQTQTSTVSFVLFGLHCTLVGYLILRASHHSASSVSHTRGVVR